MPRTVFILCGVILLGLGLGGAWGMLDRWSRTHNSATVDEPDEVSSPPELHFPNAEVDLGLVSETRRHEFTFENRGHQPVHIRRVHSSCACTLTQPERKEYRPGESGRLAVTVSPRGDAMGRQAYLVKVDYVGEQPRQAQLRVLVRFRRDVETPDGVELRSVRGKEAVTSFSVVDYREQTLAIREIKTSAADLEARIVETPDTYLPGWRHVVRVRYVGARQPGRYEESITLLTSDTTRPVLTVRATLFLERRLRVAPETLYLRAEPDGRHASGMLFIDDREGAAVEIASVKAEQPGLTFEVTTHGAGCRVKVRLDRSRMKSAPNGAAVVLRLLLKKPEQEELCVRVVP